MSRLAIFALLLLAPAGAARANSDQTPWLGIAYTAGQTGILVTHVFEETGAKGGGLQPGDEIVSIDGVELGPISNIGELIYSRSDGDMLVVRVLRGTRVLSLRPALSARLGDDELVQTHLVGHRAPPFELRPQPTAGPSVSDAILKGKVGLLAWFHTACDGCTDVIGELDSWAAKQSNKNLVVLAGAGGPLGFTDEQLDVALGSILRTNPSSIPIGSDQEGWLRYAAIQDYATRLVVAVVDHTGTVSYAATIDVSVDEPILDDVFAAAERALKPRKARRAQAQPQ